MSAQHTPGPWEVRIPFSTATRFPAYIVSNNPNERFIAAMYGSGGDYDKRPEAAQNARLVAAAPELLSVTKGFRRKLATYVSVYPGDKELRKLLDDCDAAIAKATGETK